MDDDMTLTQYLVPDYVVVSLVIEVVACIVVLVACMTLVRRGLPAVVGAVGALLGAIATGMFLADTLAMLYRDDGPWLHSETAYHLLNYCRSAGLVLVGLAALLALARTHRGGTPARLESA